MNPREAGFLLLTCSFGRANRPVLSVAQLRHLAKTMAQAEKPDPEGQVTVAYLTQLGISEDLARQVVWLLEDEELMEQYLARGEKAGCIPVTRANPRYPLILRQRLDLDSPGCLWLKGDPELLTLPAISLVGSRDLFPENADFAREVGRQAARQGFALISGNARGADQTAQEACLEAGGKVISIVANQLNYQRPRKNLLYISEDGFASPFSAQRALSRNRCIHALGRMVLVAQSRVGRGGTWDGTCRNLRARWSPVAVFQDGSPAARELEQLGACPIGLEELKDFSGLLAPVKQGQS